MPTPPKQCAHTMNNVSSCFATTFAFLIVAIDWRAAEAVVCCSNTSVASGGGDVIASCQNENRTFQTVVAYGNSTCDDNQTARQVRKCCPLEYNMEWKSCLRDEADGHGDERQLRRMWQLLSEGFQVNTNQMVGYNYEQPLCDAGDVLVNIADLEMMKLAYSSVFVLPLDYCFDLTPSDKLVAQTCHIAAVVCCNNGSVANGSEEVVASCQNKNRKFHRVEALGRGTCDDNRTAVSIRKCCAWGQYYNISENTCQPMYTYTDSRWMIQQLMQQLRDKARLVADAVMVGYNYKELLCSDPNEMVDMNASDIMLMKNKPFPEEFCFDLTPRGYPQALVCRRSERCLKNTCVHRCCKGDLMIVDGPNVPECDQNEKPFTMSAYEIDEYGRQVGLSNKTVHPYYLEFKCSHRDMLEYGFQLTEDGDLYLTLEHHIVPYTKYCVGYSQGIVTDTIVAYICDSDTVFMVERAHASSIHIFYRASYVASAVCLALTLLLYNILPSLRNIRNYSVKCYIHHQFVLCIWVIYQISMEKEKKKEKCLLFGYITLFVFLSTLCWLNVICFDIYRIIRYNISRNRNTSTSVRTVMYHFYCLGLPSIFVYTGYFFQTSHDKSLQGLAHIFELTGYGCFYYDMPGYGDFFFILSPVFVMLAANLIFFLLNAIHYSRIKPELNKFNPTDSKTENVLVYKEKFLMSIKLFLIIGIPYSLTVLCLILRIEGTKWKIIYAASSLQGVLIFIIFVAKHQVIMDLRKKFKGSMDHSEPTQINLTSGSSLLAALGSVHKC